LPGGAVGCYCAVGMFLSLDTFRNQQDSLPKHSNELLPMPLHAGLPNEDQLRIFDTASPGQRKVIVSTNIAEVRFAAEG